MKTLLNTYINKGDKTMTFDNIKNHIFAHGSIADGYSGHRAIVEFALEDNKTLIVHEHGLHNSGLPDAIDTTEALWLLQNHPTARNIIVNGVGKLNG